MHLNLVSRSHCEQLENSTSAFSRRSHSDGIHRPAHRPPCDFLIMYVGVKMQRSLIKDPPGFHDQTPFSYAFMVIKRVVQSSAARSRFPASSCMQLSVLKSTVVKPSRKGNAIGCIVQANVGCKGGCRTEGSSATVGVPKAQLN